MTILQSLTRQYDRLTKETDPARQIPRYGYSLEKISHAVVLSSGGKVVDVQSMLDITGKKPKPSQRLVPQAVVRTVNVVSNFLWDKTAYVLGVKRKDNTGEFTESALEHQEFKRHNRNLIQGCNDEGLNAFLKFLEAWHPDQFNDLRNPDQILDTNVIFRLDGQTKFLHEHVIAKETWLNHLSHLGEEDRLVGQCLVTGEVSAQARIHAKIKGVAGAQSSGASIVSFNRSSFLSYGKEQGENAPVSRYAAFAYPTALNHMLDRKNGRCVRVGDTTTVFWAETAGGGLDARISESLFSMILNPPEDDNTETSILHKQLTLIAQCSPLSDINSELNEDTRFYILGLSPNASRLSVRFWIEDSFGNLYRRSVQHFKDLLITPVPWKALPAPWMLLCETAIQRKSDKIQPTLSGALMRSILGGSPYPRSLFGAVIARIRADQQITGGRAAICKAFLTRNYRFGFETEDISMSLDKNETNVAYRLGRLFAVYENIQREAQGKSLNSTIKDQYFGAASATPASVFPVIVRKAMHHLASIKKDGRGGLVYWFENEVKAILESMGSSFPKSLRLEDQGRFIIGYYHQAFSKAKSMNENEKPGSIEDNITKTRINDDS